MLRGDCARRVDQRQAPWRQAEAEAVRSEKAQDPLHGVRGARVPGADASALLAVKGSLTISNFKR